ncbi:MAG: ketose-bisphosphate aldolase [Desulfatiglandales bacterium]
MLSTMIALMEAAREKGYALGAFNVYNLEGVRAVVAAAQKEHSPAILQIHPSAFRHGGIPLVALCLAAAREACVPMAVHLDHSTSSDDIRAALAAGLTSVMADGSHLSYADNVAFTREMVTMTHEHGGTVEAELGRLAGQEDGLAVEEYEAKLTDPDQATDFVARTGTDALAVCIGNIHGRYSSEPRLDFDRLCAIRKAVSVPIVLHGASGLPERMVSRAVELGVCKLNVNTELREAYLGALKDHLANSPDLIGLMRSAIEAMQVVVCAKLQLFGSAGKA